MIAIYLHDPRPESFDRARALVAALGEDARLVSAHPPPIGWSTDWSMLVDSTLATWVEWLQTHTPSTVVVDGPPEHARVVCDLGASLVMVATPGGGDHGERGSAYADAVAILAPWPQAASGDWPALWRERTIHLGAVGWRAGQVAHQGVAVQTSRSSESAWQAVAFWPTHAGPGPRERSAIAVETPGWRWTYAPERDLLEPGPVWSSLRRADVAVCPPAPATIAALAAFQVPAVLVLPARPSPAQTFLAKAAARTAPVLVVQPDPRPQDWHLLLESARTLDGAAWEQWSPEPGLAELAGTVLGAGGTAAGAGLATV